MIMKSKNIIDARKQLCTDITKYWSIIRTENIISKKAKEAKLGSNYDLKSVLNTINQLAEKRVKIKLLLQAINMGITNYSEFKTNTNYENIYKLNEANEAFTQISLIETIKPQFKAQKGEDSTFVETFSFAKKQALLKDLTLKINNLNKKIKEFNDNTEITMDDELSSLFAA